MKPCSLTTCPNPARSYGYCTTHSRNFLATGDPLVPPSRAVDPVAVERAVAGEPAGRLTVAEKEEAVRRLDRMGVGSSQIAARVGFASRNSVGALRRRLRTREVPA